jgi:hypothetical protein
MKTILPPIKELVSIRFNYKVCEISPYLALLYVAHEEVFGTVNGQGIVLAIKPTLRIYIKCSTIKIMGFYGSH